MYWLKFSGDLPVNLVDQHLSAPVRIICFRIILPVVVGDEAALLSEKCGMGHDFSHLDETRSFNASHQFVKVVRLDLFQVRNKGLYFLLVLSPGKLLSGLVPHFQP